VSRLVLVVLVAAAGGLAYSAAGGGTLGRVAGAVARELVRLVAS
jgi:hypothetical protein